MPATLSVDPTITPTPTDTLEVEQPKTATSTLMAESEPPTETPLPTAEPTIEQTLEPTLESTQEPTPSPTIEIESGPKPNCEEKAAFYGDITVPDDTTFRQGEVFTKIWKVRNEGTCTWDSNYSLVFAGGAQMNGASGSPLPDAAPGDIIQIPLELTAPLRGGTHVGNWMMSDPYGDWFGVGATRKGEIWVRILVNYIAPGNSETDSGTDTGSGGTQPAACGSQQDTSYENQVFTSINNARSSNGLSPLLLKGELSKAALAHSTDMACNDFVDHSGSDGSLWFDRITREGYVYTTAKENIYVGNPAFGGTPQGAFDWWMNSQIHRENILSDDITEIGIAFVFNPDSTYGGYYTTVFARP